MPMGLSVPGRLGADPEIRSTANGTTVANFRVAVDGYDREAKEKTTTWVRVTMWGARGEQIAKLVSKGDAVCFIGTGELREYNGKTYLECTAGECALMGSGKQRSGTMEQAAKQQNKGKRGASEEEEDFPSDW